MAVPILTCHCCRPIFGHLKPRNLASILGPENISPVFKIHRGPLLLCPKEPEKLL